MWQATPSCQSCALSSCAALSVTRQHVKRHSAAGHPCRCWPLTVTTAVGSLACSMSTAGPGWQLVGRDGASAVWLLAQHADEDLTLQRRWLDLLSQAVDAGAANPAHLAQPTWPT